MNAWEPNDSGSGNIVRDLTGHGYDAVGGQLQPDDDGHQVELVRL